MESEMGKEGSGAVLDDRNCLYEILVQRYAITPTSQTLLLLTIQVRTRQYRLQL